YLRALGLITAPAVLTLHQGHDMGRPGLLEVELREGEVWVRPSFGRGDPSHHWRRRLDDGLAHNLGLIVAKAVRGQLTAG
ncbi:hypothetical protein ACSNOK_36085, partial [Streptomyces sp. URMC 126]